MLNAQTADSHIRIFLRAEFQEETFREYCGDLCADISFTDKADSVLDQVSRCVMCLIILDLRTPNAESLELCGRLREVSRSDELNILALVNSVAEADVEQLFEAGFDDCIDMTNPKLLRLRVRHHLRSTHAVMRHLTAREDLCRINSELENIVSDRTTELRAFNDNLQKEVVERRQAQEDLAVKEAQLRQIIDLVPHFIFAKDREGRFVIVNKAVADGYNLTVEQMINRRIHDFHETSEELTAYLEDDKRAMESGQPHMTPEVRFTAPNGETRYMQTTKIPLHLAGHDESVVLGISIDITEHKRILADLRERDERLQMLANQMPAIIWTTDPELNLTSFSGAGLQIFGFKPIAKTRVPLKWFFGYNRHKTNKPDLPMRMLHKVVRTNATANFEIEWEKRHLDVHLAPLLDKDGTTLGTIGMALDITTKFRAEQELRERDVLLDNVRRLTNLAMISIDLPSQNLFASTEFNQIIGLPAGSELGSISEYLDLVHDEDRSDLAQVIDNPSSGFGRRPLYHRVIRPNGEVRHLNAQFDAIRDSNGRTIRVLGLFTDITKRKLVETQLQRSEARFSEIVNSVGEAIIAFTTRRRIVIFNHAAETTFAYSEQDIAGESFNRLLPNEEVDKLQARLDQIDETDATGGKRRAINCLRSDGTQFTAEISFSLLEVNGEFLYVAVLRDVTERVRAEQELHNVNVQLAAINKELRQFIDAANAPIFGIDRAGLVNEWNRRAEQLTGYSRDELMGRDPIEVLIAPEAQKAVSDILHAALDGLDTEDYEMPVITNKLDRVILLINATARRNADGEIIGVIGVGQDITERMRAARELAAERMKLAETVERRTRELRLANKQLARANQMKDDFLAGMSHELRTPLNTILGMSESLTDGVYGEINKRQTAAVKHIEESGTHLLALINDILDLSKIGANKLELEIDLVSVPAVCETSVMFISKFADRKNITVNIEFTNECKQIQADELRLKQILVNLLNNAVKFTEEGGDIGLRVRDSRDGESIRFEVWDSGIGIEPRHIEQLFQPFVQVDNKLTRRFPGTGLGLSLVYRLTKMHRGMVHVDSTPGKGSCFTVVLPTHQPTRKIRTPDAENFPFHIGPGAEQEKLPGRPPTASPESETQPLVLLAEDNPYTIKTITEYLQAKNFRVINASDGFTAVELARVHLPDIILMDIQLPRMNGLEAIRKLRQDEATKNLPLIALTAFAMRGDRERCLEAGADQYLSKPVRLQNLHRLIVSSLD